MKTSIIFGPEAFFLVVASRVGRKVVHINGSCIFLLSRVDLQDKGYKMENGDLRISNVPASFISFFSETHQNSRRA